MRWKQKHVTLFYKDMQSELNLLTIEYYLLLLKCVDYNY